MRPAAPSMKKLLNKPWFVAVLAIAAVALIAQTLLDQGPARPRASAVDSAGEMDEYVEEDATVEPVARSLAEVVKALPIPDSIPDPFSPRGVRRTAVEDGPKETVPDETETVHLSAIWEQDGSAYILINGRICRPGDAIGRITIQSVEREGVWLAHWKGRSFLTLGNDFTLVTPASPAANPRTVNHEG